MSSEHLDDGQTLSWKGLDVGISSFLYKDRRREFSQIESLTFLRKATKVSINLIIPAGTDHEAYLSIRLLGELKEINVAYTGSITKQPSPKAEGKANRVEAIFERLANATFEQRLRRYLDQVDAAGQFVYNGKVFRRDGMVEDGKKRFNLLDYALQRKPFNVIIQVPYSDNRWKRMRQKWNDFPGIQIVTVTDADCFFALLQTVFGIEWRELNGLVLGLPVNKWPAVIEALKRGR